MSVYLPGRLHPAMFKLMHNSQVHPTLHISLAYLCTSLHLTVDAPHFSLVCPHPTQCTSPIYPATFTRVYLRTSLMYPVLPVQVTHPKPHPLVVHTRPVHPAPVMHIIGWGEREAESYHHPVPVHPTLAWSPIHPPWMGWLIWRKIPHHESRQNSVGLSLVEPCIAKHCEPLPQLFHNVTSTATIKQYLGG